VRKRGGAPKRQGRQGKATFLKKSSKKLLLAGAWTFEKAQAQIQKSFLVFFQKRTACLAFSRLDPFASHEITRGRGVDKFLTLGGVL